MRGNLAPSVYMVFIIQLRFRLYALKSSYFSGEGGNQLFPFLRRNRLMTYADFASAQSIFLWSTFAIALIMGAVVNKTNFCTMGAVSDWGQHERHRPHAFLDTGQNKQQTKQDRPG